MPAQTLIQTWIDGYEEDQALAVTVTFDALKHVGPCLKLMGPDGEVELVGTAALTALHTQIERQLRFSAARANREAEVA